MAAFDFLTDFLAAIFRRRRRRGFFCSTTSRMKRLTCSCDALSEFFFRIREMVSNDAPRFRNVPSASL